MNLRQFFAGLAVLGVLFFSASPVFVYAQETGGGDQAPETTDTPADEGAVADTGSETTVTPQQSAADNNVVFIPLTGIPGVQDVSGANSIADFLNVLYRLCVGVAASLAVIQIIRGGVTWMRSDSVTGNKEAKDLIRSSIFGLVLVLSPVVVFGLIDPRILNLNLDASQLQLDGGATLGTMGSGAGMTEEQRSVFKDDLRRVLQACNIPASDETIECLSGTPSDADTCFTPPLSSEQRTCFGERAAREANKCDSLDIHEGSIVQPDFRSCCLDAGLTSVQNRNSSSYTCTNNPPEEGYSLEAASGSYNFVLYALSSDQSCIQLVHGSYPTQSACSEGLTAASAARSGYTPFYQCVQPPLPATIFNKPVCSSVERLP